MQQGVVKLAAKNIRGHRFGFVESHGEIYYFNEVGGSNRLIHTVEGLAFGSTWEDASLAPRRRSEFPKIHETLHFEADPRPSFGNHPSVKYWCNERDYQVECPPEELALKRQVGGELSKLGRRPHEIRQRLSDLGKSPNEFGLKKHLEEVLDLQLGVVTRRCGATEIFGLVGFENQPNPSALRIDRLPANIQEFILFSQLEYAVRP